MNPCLGILLVALTPLADKSVHVRPVDPGGLRVTVTAALSEDLQERFTGPEIEPDLAEPWLSFRLVDEASGAEGPPIFGSYERKGNSLVFAPRYRLLNDQLYRAVFRRSADDKQSTEYRTPRRSPTPTTIVDRIEPTASVLPANLLKFYIHFSRPMREGHAIFEQIQIRDDQGAPVHEPWRRTELWSDDARRLTLWIHPGRVKTGVNLNVELGPVLHPGRNYTLHIGKEMLDADGQALGKDYVKEFTTSQPDRSRPLMEDWKLTLPTTGSREPLLVEFGEALDAPLVQRTLKILDTTGARIAGKGELGAAERSWPFTPDEPWTGKEHSLVAGEFLEDLAGNTPVRVFDTDLSLPPPAPPTLKLPFTPKRP